MSDRDRAAIVSESLERIQNSAALTKLIETTQPDGPLDFDPDSTTTSVDIVERTCNDLVIEITEEVSAAPVNPDYDGYIRNTIEAHFFEDDLIRVTLTHDHQYGWLTGKGWRATYEDGDIELNVTRIS